MKNFLLTILHILGKIAMQVLIREILIWEFAEFQKKIEELILKYILGSNMVLPFFILLAPITLIGV